MDDKGSRIFYTKGGTPPSSPQRNRGNPLTPLSGKILEEVLPNHETKETIFSLKRGNRVSRTGGKCLLVAKILMNHKFTRHVDDDDAPLQKGNYLFFEKRRQNQQSSIQAAGISTTKVTKHLKSLTHSSASRVISKLGKPAFSAGGGGGGFGGTLFFRLTFRDSSRCSSNMRYLSPLVFFCGGDGFG